MSKKEETTEETTEEVKTEVETNKVALGQVATAHERVFMTPDGNFDLDGYLVWLGNMFLNFKAAIAGN